MLITLIIPHVANLYSITRLMEERDDRETNCRGARVIVFPGYGVYAGMVEDWEVNWGSEDPSPGAPPAGDLVSWVTDALRKHSP